MMPCLRLDRWSRPGFCVLFLLLALSWACSARAAVEIRFHSKDFGATFPHAFIVLHGTLDETGETVDANFGFTLKHLVGPSALFGAAVDGVVESAGPAYIAGSNHHFTLVLSDGEYRRVMTLVERWRALPQPSYRLMRRNCVTFVADVAMLLGLTADTRGLMRRPRAFLDRVRAANEVVIARRAPRSEARTGG